MIIFFYLNYYLQTVNCCRRWKPNKNNNEIWFILLWQHSFTHRYRKKLKYKQWVDCVGVGLGKSLIQRHASFVVRYFDRCLETRTIAADHRCARTFEKHLLSLWKKEEKCYFWIEFSSSVQNWRCHSLCQLTWIAEISFCTFILYFCSVCSVLFWLIVDITRVASAAMKLVFCARLASWSAPPNVFIALSMNELIALTPKLFRATIAGFTKFLSKRCWTLIRPLFWVFNRFRLKFPRRLRFGCTVLFTWMVMAESMLVIESRRPSRSRIGTLPGCCCCGGWCSGSSSCFSSCVRVLIGTNRGISTEIEN